MLAYARHGDFKKVSEILQGALTTLTLNGKCGWAYTQIADEYIKHGKPISSLRSYLTVVSELPVGENAGQWVKDTKTEIIARKNKIMLHEKLTTQDWKARLQNHKNDDTTSLSDATIGLNISKK
jgi:hypothetical protein